MHGVCSRYSANGEGASDGPCTRTQRGGGPLGVHHRHNSVGKVRPPLTVWGSRVSGCVPVQVTGRWGARRGGQASDGQRRPSTTGAVAIGTRRSRSSTPRSVYACEVISMTAASAATFGVCCGSSRRRSGPGTSGCAVAASASGSTGRDSRTFSDNALSPAHGSWSGSGVGNHESHRQKSRMEEIS
jgi:hypothetical protein